MTLDVKDACFAPARVGGEGGRARASLAGGACVWLPGGDSGLRPTGRRLGGALGASGGRS
ncbi:hypothetical protein [Sorangium sp. So ce861]|uniref:hypothetical protein n=1 Tax=Sorangium sp. So ce861 TaxID=3133323 RepID=UPI003F5E8489